MSSRLRASRSKSFGEHVCDNWKKRYVKDITIVLYDLGAWIGPVTESSVLQNVQRSEHTAVYARAMHM